MPRRTCDQRIPTYLRVIMSVVVNDSWGDYQISRINHLSSPCVDLSYLRDASIGDRYVGAIPRRPSTIDHSPILDQYVIRHRVSTLLVRAAPTVEGDAATQAPQTILRSKSLAYKLAVEIVAMTSVAAASATSLSVGADEASISSTVCNFRLTSTVFAANHRWMRNFTVIAIGLVNDSSTAAVTSFPQFPCTIEPIITPA